MALKHCGKPMRISSSRWGDDDDDWDGPVTFVCVVCGQTKVVKTNNDSNDDNNSSGGRKRRR